VISIEYFVSPLKRQHSSWQIVPGIVLKTIYPSLGSSFYDANCVRVYVLVTPVPQLVDIKTLVLEN